MARREPLPGLPDQAGDGLNEFPVGLAPPTTGHLGHRQRARDRFLKVMSGEASGWVKTIHEASYGELLGVVIVGPHATDLIEAAVVALDAESTIETVADGMAAHPTLGEGLKIAGQVALGRAIDLPPRRR